MSLRIWHLWGSTIFGSRRLIKVIQICQLSKLSLNICIHSGSFPSKSRFKHYASRKFLFPVHSHYVDRDKRSFIHSFIHMLIVQYPIQFIQFNRPYIPLVQYLLSQADASSAATTKTLLHLTIEYTISLQMDIELRQSFENATHIERVDFLLVICIINN